MAINGHILVSGGGKGIGRAITDTLLDNDYRVSALGRDRVNLNHENASFFECDVTDFKNLDSVVKEVMNKGGPINGLVNNVGRSAWKKLEDISTDFWNTMISVNTGSTLFLTQAVVKNSEGIRSVVNISSLAGKRGSANNTAYCASKFAVNGITQSLAKELGVNGIRVNAICPVYVKTDGVVQALLEDGTPRGHMDLEAYFETFAYSNSALKRLPLGKEVGNSCAFLLADESSAITGQCINVDCGVLPQ
tara:strand:- start:143 stop:889 length:747 start_codon:yes stop_codon:yes gene_type:complete